MHDLQKFQNGFNFYCACAQINPAGFCAGCQKVKKRRVPGRVLALSASLCSAALPKGEPLAIPADFISLPRPLPLTDFPRPGQILPAPGRNVTAGDKERNRCRHRRQKGERGGTAIAMTERASLLKIKAPAAPPPGLGARVGRAQMLSRADHLFSGRGNRIRRVHQLFSQWRVMLPPCCWAAVRRLFRSGSWSGRPSGPSSGGVSV